MQDQATAGGAVRGVVSGRGFPWGDKCNPHLPRASPASHRVDSAPSVTPLFFSLLWIMLRKAHYCLRWMFLFLEKLAYFLHMGAQDGLSGKPFYQVVCRGGTWIGPGVRSLGCVTLG